MSRSHSLFICEWSWLWDKHERAAPCHRFTVFAISFQGGPYQGGYFEFDIRILGLGWNFDWHAEGREAWAKRLAAGVRERLKEREASGLSNEGGSNG